MFNVQTILQIFKLEQRYYITAIVPVTVLIFSPEKLLNSLGLTQIVNDYRSILGITFIALISLIMMPLWTGICKIFSNFKIKRKIKKRLLVLTEDEKKILRFYIFFQTRSNYLRIQDGTVNALAGASIIYMSAQAGDMVNGFAFNINEIAWNYLNENQSLLDGQSNEYRTDKIKIVDPDSIFCGIQ